MGKWMEVYEDWAARDLEDPALNEEMAGLREDDGQIEARFKGSLAFGTGGLRGIAGAGTACINIHTVRRATQGLADYLHARFLHPSVCIAWDTRQDSRRLARSAAEVLCGNGVTTYLFDDARPTPMLSYAVRRCEASAGIVITASHNPREYNGYKVYNGDGGQITDEAAREIGTAIASCVMFEGIRRIPLDEAAARGLLHGMTLYEEYCGKVAALALRPELCREQGSELRILYTPLHGTGAVPVRRALALAGFAHVESVPGEEDPDGCFPKAPPPNPENPAVFEKALARARETKPDIIFATDPDCDRIGVLSRDSAGEYRALSGNRMGALLCEYILRTQKERGALPANAAIVKTIVTTELARKICISYGARLFDVLTGFKYIGEKMGEWERTGEYAFAFGFEESCGYLMGDFVRDKDAVIASVLIAEMALHYKTRGMTLWDALAALQEEYGYWEETLVSLELAGPGGAERAGRSMEGLRRNCREFFGGLAAMEDYNLSTREDFKTEEKEALHLPKSDVVKLIFEDGSWMALRPSKTEPKLKLYIGATGGSPSEAAERLEALKAMGQCILKME